MSDKAPNKEGKRYAYQDQIFYAWNGRVAIEDQRDGNFKTMSAPEFFARAISFNAAVKKASPAALYPDERAEMQGLVIAMCECVKEARAQGDPSDPEVMKQVSKENRPISVSMGNPGADARLTHAAKHGTSPVYFLPQAEGIAIKSELFKQMRL